MWNFVGPGEIPTRGKTHGWETKTLDGAVPVDW